MTTFYRPGWDQYFLILARAVARRADCRRRQVGAVLVDSYSHIVISTGYNGSVPGGPSCLAGECPRGLLSYNEVAEFTDYKSGPGRCHARHAEDNAIYFAERAGRLTQGATLYITDSPCPDCQALITEKKIARVVTPTVLNT